MEIGDKIRYHRKQNGLTQEELAKDICTRAYLSKIENNIAKPHQETINLLFKKLEVSISEESINVENFNEKLYRWYEIIKNRDKDKAKKIEMSLNSEIAKITNPEILIQYQLFSLRYQLLLRNFDESNKLTLKLESIKDTLSDKQKYYYYYFLGLYKYIQNDLIDSLEYYSKAEKINHELNINESELFYLLSLVHTKLYNVTLAIKYSNLALENFNFNMDYFKSIESQSVLSINYIRIGEFDKAEHHLKSSLKMAEKLSDKYLTSNIYHNLGFLHSRNNEHDIAIGYYQKSIVFRKEKYEKLANTIYYLTESYFALNDFDTAHKWLEEGLKVTKENNIINIQIKFNLLKLEYYNDKDKIAKFIEEIGLPYLEERQAWPELGEASEKLATYYANLKHYKDAYKYCYLANKYKIKI